MKTNRIIYVSIVLLFLICMAATCNSNAAKKASIQNNFKTKKVLENIDSLNKSLKEMEERMKYLSNKNAEKVIIIEKTVDNKNISDEDLKKIIESYE